MRIVYNIILILISLFLDIGNLKSYNQNDKRCAPVTVISEKDRAFGHGEILKYTVSYNWGMVNSDVGEIEASLNRVKDPKYGDVFHSVIRGNTFRFYDVFFKVRDLFESKFRVDNGRPLYFHRDISEGKYRMKNWYQFRDDYSIEAKVQRKNRDVMDTILKGDICTFDLVSLFYFSRNLDFSNVPEGVEQPISFAIDSQIYNLYYKFIGKEVFRLRGVGTFNSLKFVVRVVAGEVFSGKEEITLWVTDDKNKVPLYFESPIIVGRVSGRLKSYDNLKHPLTSKIR